jgi:hypothetical protein
MQGTERARKSGQHVAGAAQVDRVVKFGAKDQVIGRQ